MEGSAEKILAGHGAVSHSRVKDAWKSASPSGSDWLAPGCYLPASGHVGKVSITGPRRSEPPYDTTGFSRATLNRWRQAWWSEGLDGFMTGSMVTGADEAGTLRRPAVEELEVIFGFEVGHTVPAVKSGALKSSTSTWARKVLIGQSLQVGLIQPFLAMGLESLGETSLPEGDLASGPSRGWTLDQRLVVEHLRGVDHRGSDVRIDAGTFMSPSSWPRRSLRAELWRWQTKFHWQWRMRDTDHINILEAQASLLTLKWRLRSRKGVAKKFLHLVDSQVVQAVLSKHRSSSRKLNRLCRKWAALELASSCHPLLGFIRSDKNPADAPSRNGA